MSVPGKTETPSEKPAAAPAGLSRNGKSGPAPGAGSDEPTAVVKVTAAATPTPTRLAGLVRWGARVTSLPVLALAVYFLIPDLASFAVAARDDKIIALALCTTCLGLLTAWKWAGVGGALTLASAVVMLAQGESFLNPDPFSLAFGLQGILFLVSSVLNSRRAPGAAPALGWPAKAAVGLLAVCALGGAATILRGPGPVALPKDKEMFVGVWENGAGFSLEITADGHAKVSQAKDAKIEAGNSPIVPGGTEVFQASFQGDERLELARGFFGGSKVYRIERHPHLEGKEIRMTLNASEPNKRGSGVTLVKKQSVGK